MADYFFTLFCHLIIDVILVRFQLLNLFVRDVQSQLFFRLCKRDPESSPGLKFHVR